MEIQDRVKELRRVKARELRPNPKNWRKHPEAQANALRGLLAEIGFAGAALARELPDGTLQLIDGHLRAETTPDNEIPVLILDVNEEEADKLLATFDRVSDMAEHDDDKLRELLDGITFESEDVQAMFADLDAAEVPADEEPDTSEQMGDLIHRIVIDCPSEAQQAEWLAVLEQQGIPCRALIL
jgi:hypothetical protein